jgi:hypothetical protein
MSAIYYILTSSIMSTAKHYIRIDSKISIVVTVKHFK